jgi:hypothetical protein
MADNLRGRLEILKEIEQVEVRIDRAKQSTVLTQLKINKYVDDQKKKVIELSKELKQANTDRLNGFAAEESSIKSMSSMYDQLKESQKSSNTLASSMNSLSATQLDSLKEIQRINRDIAQLTIDDIQGRTALTNEYNNSMDSLTENLHGNTKIVQQLKSQNSLAGTYANMTESQKQILQSQHDILDGIKNTIVGTIETTVTLYGNLQGAIGGVITGFGFVVDKIGEANKQLGATLFQTDGVARKAGVLSFIFDDAASNAKDLSAELGNTSRASFEAQTNIGLMSMNMGISGNEAVALTGAFTRLNGNSLETATNMVATSKEFAKQNGIIPAQLMGDLANAAEEFALYGKQGGANILQAAGYAAKLGTNMKTLSGIADGLLDFESSITKELELGAMLGKNINLNRARALAYEGDIAGATKETLAQLGGIEAFNRMDYFQKKQTADLLGVSVAELQKMATNMENAGNLGSVMNEKFSQMGEFIDGGLNKWLGTSLKTMGGMITAAAQIGGSFAQMGFDVKGLASKLPGVGKFFNKGASVASQATPSITSNLPDSKAGAGGQNSIVKSISKIKPSQILAGAAALVIVAGAVFVFGKAVQEFMKVSWESVGMAVVSMLALVGAVALLGVIMSTGVGSVAILAGAAAMLVVAASVYVLGKAIQEMASGFKMLSSVSSMIDGMVSNVGGIMLLTGSLFALAGALTAVGTAGLISIPGLVALGAIGTAVSGINSLLGISSEETGGVSDESIADYQQKMLDKLEEIRVATATNRDVYLDKEKVTRLVVSTDERNSVNKFSLNNG